MDTSTCGVGAAIFGLGVSEISSEEKSHPFGPNTSVSIANINKQHCYSIPLGLAVAFLAAGVDCFNLYDL